MADETVILNKLLNAPSKEFLFKLVNDVFSYDPDAKRTDELSYVSATLEVENSTADQIVQELSSIIKNALANGLDDVQSVQKLFDENVQANLRTLLSKVIVEQLPKFKKTTLNSHSMVPKLIDFEWRTDVNMASNLQNTPELVGKTGQTCVVQFKIQDACNQDEIKNLNVEFTKQSLNTMLDGLMKIKEQLVSISSI